MYNATFWIYITLGYKGTPDHIPNFRGARHGGEVDFLFFLNENKALSIRLKT